MTQIGHDSNADGAAVVNIYVRTKQVFSTELENTLWLGRQRADEAPPYARVADRVIIAKLEESSISREHIHLELLNEAQVSITNLSRVNKITVGTDEQVQPGSQTKAAMPTLITVGDRVIQLEPKAALHAPELLDSFTHQTTLLGAHSEAATHLLEALSIRRSEDDTQYLLRGLHATVGFFQLASNSAEFLSMAAQAMIDVVGLETAAALMWDGRDWRTEAICTRPGSPTPEETEWVPSRSILQRVRDERKTFWKVPDGAHAASLIDVKALVAAPVLNRKAEVIGALYGDRRRRPGGRIDLQITEVEAILVELLSTSVAAGFARLEHEKAAVEARVLFEQFFTPELSRQLEAQPDLLLGKDTDVSLLFCDIRRFSEVSEQLGARLTIDWIQDVMETLSSCVSEYHGVLVDTLGDQLIGMWGAPVEREDHAELACRAAIAMVEQLPALNRRWLNALDRPMDLGIGIHTGIARVGNIGSTSKFKYGPLGTTVRVASQVEQATRELMVKILITDTTAERLPDDLPTRRLCRLDDANREQPIQIFELTADTPADWSDMKRCYESALDAFDRGDLPTATRLLAKLLSDHPNDRASLRLLTQIEARLP
ncbi:MAG: hypothetical protein CMJ64_29490 [Planctomycetaceae bacterium]|nr:hypothetical protein [Planctomycetaceae bacterium]